MSSGGGGGGGGGGDHHGDYHQQHGHHSQLARADGADHYVFNHNDVESFFFNQPAASVGGGSRTGADELMPPYSNLTDYLQGFLDPSGLARHLDAPLSAEDPAVKNELSVDVSLDSQGTSGVAGEGAALLTPNSSVSLSSSDREGEGQPSRSKKGRVKAEDEEGAEVDEKDQEERENSMKAMMHPIAMGMNPNMYLPSMPSPPPMPTSPAPPPPQQSHFTDYALLQDLFPSNMPTNP
ncbi:hypothetical protein EJB05_17771 [Eragrostis curvula]|uniref:Uncharacterized protein n=1 Tax=Eragrostis curvula TaxID=38414 RepID=A0A5J9VK86_9POAL|nr:hypothetical protein EJB05_17771 [Eragrostis curvula]